MIGRHPQGAARFHCPASIGLCDGSLETSGGKVQLQVTKGSRFGFCIIGNLMISRSVTTITLALGLTFPAFSQGLDLKNGFTLTGEVELEYAHYDGAGTNQGAYAFVDLGLKWRGQAANGFGLGVDVDLVGTDATGSDSDFSKVWGGLVLTTDLGDLTIGTPRSLIKTMILAPNLGGFTAFERSNDSFGGSWLESFGVADFVNISGVSFKGTKGVLSYGASYNWISSDLPGDSKQRILELAAVLETGKIRLQAGFQQREFLGVSVIRRSLGATFTGDRLSAGVLRSETPSGFFPTSSTLVFADYDITDALTLGAQANQTQIGNFWTNIYGLTGEYTLANGAFAQAGLYSAPDYDVTHAEVSIGFRF
jgi:hypothetical protein